MGAPASSAPAVTALPSQPVVPSLRVPDPKHGQHETLYDAPTLDQPVPTSSYHPTNRKPVGPRPIGGATGPAEDDLFSTAPPPHIPSSASTLPARASAPVGYYASRPSTSDSTPPAAPFPHVHSLPPTKPHYRPTFTPYTLTLIRRDPTSGDQKNVARITSFQTNIPTPDAADPTLSPDHMPRPEPPAVHIRIETLGYGKFGNWPTRAALDRLAAEGNLNLRPGETFVDGPVRRSRGTSFNSPVPAQQGFNREVRMAYGKTWTSNIKSALHIRHRSQGDERRHSETEPYGADELMPPRAPAMGGHRRGASTGSTGSADSLGSGSGGPTFGSSPTSPSSPIITRRGPGLKPKGYVFASPWDGRCEFRTGRAGRSLECRHVLGSSSAGFDTAAEGRGATGTKLVSELRFNLPGGSDGGGAAGQGHHRGRHSFHGKIDKLLKLDPRHRHDSSDEDEDDVALDLSLGRERAGGGRLGNRAKLGKLILHDEGQKMMDLAVAANIGVWWATWERASASYEQ